MYILLAVSFFKALWSTAINSLFGVLQMGAIGLMAMLSTKVDFDIDDFYKDGFMLFFTVAILTGIMFEYFFDAEVKTNRYLDAFIAVTCCLVCGGCMLAFGQIFLEIDSTHEVNSKIFQNSALVIALVASILLKWIIYFKKGLV